MHYWRLHSVSSAWPTLFCEVAALLDRNCIFRLSAVSLTMFEGWSPPDPMTSDSEVICEAWASSVCRSEEHTSELQSLMRISYAVFCLKKKKTLILKHINILNYHSTIIVL